MDQKEDGFGHLHPLGEMAPEQWLAEATMKIADAINRQRWPKHAAPLNDLLEDIDLPPSTHHMLEQRGDGCPTFNLGRRRYVLLNDWKSWLEKMAATAA